MRDSSSGPHILHQTSTFSTTPTQANDRVRAFAEARCAGYEVLGSLGHGGGGKVFEVRNLKTGSVEAMKVLGLPPWISVTALERVRREIALQASIEHPNIVRFNTARITDSFALLFMELLDGPSLARRLRFGSLPLRQSLNYTAQIACALGHLHKNGILHRDIKPSNIVVTSSGVAKLLDFGVARPLDSQLTGTGQVVGSLQYMPPEQIALGGRIDARSDIYSAGVTLYELLTGVRPFDSLSPSGVIAAHLRGEPIPASEIQPALSPDVNDLVMRAIARKPCDRFQTALEFRDAILAAERAIFWQTGGSGRPN